MSNTLTHDDDALEPTQSADEMPRMRADARRNRDQILIAAREVFTDHGSDAPLEEIARQAGVGIGTLYRRFPDRPSLLRAVALDALGRVAQAARLALTEEADAFQALARYMHSALDLRIGVVMPALVGQIPLADAQLLRARDAASALIQEIIDRAQAEGRLRSDIAFADIGLLLVRLARPLPSPLPRALDDRLAHRHLDLLLDGLRAAPDCSATPLPGPAMTLPELRALSPDSASAEQEQLPGQSNRLKE